MFIVEVIVMVLLGLAILIAFTGLLGFAVLIYGLMQLYKNDYK